MRSIVNGKIVETYTQQTVLGKLDVKARLRMFERQKNDILVRQQEIVNAVSIIQAELQAIQADIDELTLLDGMI